MKKVVQFTAIAVLLLSTAVHAKERTIYQLNSKFIYNDKNVEDVIINVGDSIRFKNIDSLFHNIFSLSKVNKFDLGPFDKGDAKSVKFSKAGVVEVECIYHPKMYLQVTVQ